MATTSNNPGQSALAQYSDSQLLILILTELRLLTRVTASVSGEDEDLDALRVELMNDNDITTADAG